MRATTAAWCSRASSAPNCSASPAAFLIADLYLRETAEAGFRYGAFLWRKLGWVYPLHLVTLAAMAALIWQRRT